MPRSLVGQLALLILGAFLVAQAVSFWLFAGERGQAIRAAQRLETADRAVTVAGLLETATAPGGEVILQAANSPLVRFKHGPTPLVGVEESGPNAVTARIIERLGVNSPADVRATEIPISPRTGERATPPSPLRWLHRRMIAAGVAPVELRLSIPLTDGGWLNVAARFQRPDPQAPPAVLGATALSLAVVLAALWVGLRRITGPLRRLSGAAEGVGLDSAVPEMPRAGPREVRTLTDALTRMHGRLSAMVSERTQMLAALGHDLRSPLTALRVRAEMVDDDETRERMVVILDEMQEMVDTTLAFARGVSPDHPAEPVDLSALVFELANEVSEAGPSVHVVGPSHIVRPLSPVPMRRAFRNLLENAQRYGNEATVTLEQVGPSVRILIEDNGPGIPDGDLERVFQPFVRLETSRSRETGGSGLGLPIARAILRAHGGDVVLSNRTEGGLRATVQLPLVQDGPSEL